MTRTNVNAKEIAEARKKQPAKIAIALVSHEMVPIKFAYDLARMTMYTAANMPDGVELGLNLLSGTYVHTARQDMIEQLIQAGVTHILWIDTDMEFPEDSLIRLLMHKKSVVGINYAVRGLPPRYVALKKVATDTESGFHLATTPESTGLEEVEGLGFGLVLTRIDALNKLPFDKGEPFFNFEWLPTKRQWVGEDVFFWNLLRKAGVKLYVDHDLSKECGHIGQFTYKLDGVSSWEDSFKAAAAAEASNGGEGEVKP